MNAMDTGLSRRWIVPLSLLLALGVAAWLVEPQFSAWGHLNRGKAALDRDDPAEARRQLEACLAIWSSSGEAHFLAAQAARRGGDGREAERHLDEAARLGWVATEVELERALIQAQSGNLAAVEGVLLKAVSEGHPDTPNILAVLVPALGAEFRWIDADTLSAKWVEQRPDSARAWRERGIVLERVRRTEASTAAYRRAVELDPEDRRARIGLARMLLETRQSPAEAAEHLERLTAADPKDPVVRLLLATCREAQNRPEEAAALLDRLIAEHPDAAALHRRGRLELDRGRPADAIGYLRRAAELRRADPEILYSLLLCLKQIGTPDETREVEERFKKCEADLKRVGELGRAISASPHNPDLRAEIGELFLRNGQDREGLRWLESALRERPDHAPTHRVLAAYYERTGQQQFADYHRAIAAGAPPGVLTKP